MDKFNNIKNQKMRDAHPELIYFRDNFYLDLKHWITVLADDFFPRRLKGEEKSEYMDKKSITTTLSDFKKNKTWLYKSFKKTVSYDHLRIGMYQSERNKVRRFFADL